MKKYILRKLETLSLILVNAFEGVRTHNLRHELTRIAIKETVQTGFDCY